ncbi:hypothetical protein MRB53_010030 [Persea americana]|uniref:Uncharacterized protein n=1 Tax=Persea americana TaxID=3435 RepID=A0ACC2LRF9_PERAE|nr:hypothetical protein MRB53_010030 [Persea americana]
MASRQPMHGIFMEPPFNALRESVNIIHTSHGVEERNITSLLKADEPISANAKIENVGSILKPMSSAGLTNEAAKGFGTTDTPPSTAVCSEQGALFYTYVLRGQGCLESLVGS